MPFYILGTGRDDGNFLCEIIYFGKENTDKGCVMFELLSLVTCFKNWGAWDVLFLFCGLFNTDAPGDLGLSSLAAGGGQQVCLSLASHVFLAHVLLGGRAITRARGKTTIEMVGKSIQRKLFSPLCISCLTLHKQ